MGISFKIDAKAGIIFSVAEGKNDGADLQGLHTRFAADPLYQPEFPHLFDGRSAKFSFSGREARELGTWGKQNRPTSKTAIVIDKEAQGYARMFQGWREGDSHIFYDMGSARNWLGLPPEEE